MAARKDKQRGASPTHNLKVWHPGSDEKAVLGVGWQNADGSVTIKLNAFVVLSERELSDMHLRLFPSHWEPSTDRVFMQDEPPADPANKAQTGWESEVPGQ